MIRTGRRIWNRNASTGAGEGGLKLTDAAVERLKELRRDGGNEEVLLRVRVDAGGCSGFQYRFDLMEGPPGEKDRVFEKDGQKVVVDDVSLAFVEGATVDYVEELIKQSFQVVDNPNAEMDADVEAPSQPDDPRNDVV
eukprot:CAMPEP_0183832400 /NCGR_PEP_ID=MMETSP0807_2-20130328/5323_1 /TAXON_ID=88271 /ORGANISM="Picocystis salinarum, Strain CCMP1897" /LENGTH=137 /DNA_ID=CAMNT_0026078039 /DNA_START=303 /DNA_END=717 /DNA_ORIENTATION=+